MENEDGHIIHKPFLCNTIFLRLYICV